MIMASVVLSCDFYPIPEIGVCLESMESFESIEEAEEWVKSHGWLAIEMLTPTRHLCPIHAPRKAEYIERVLRDAKGPF